MDKNTPRKIKIRQDGWGHWWVYLLTPGLGGGYIYIASTSFSSFPDTIEWLTEREYI